MTLDQNQVRKVFLEGLRFCKWLLYSGATGLLVGAVAAAFHLGIDWGAELRGEHPWILYFLPLGGIAIVLLYRLSGMEKDQGTNLVLIAVREAEPMRLRTAPLIFVATILTHLVGGSAGREGAALQLGGSLGAWLGRVVHLDAKDRRVMVMCGMSAAFSALFGTPLTAMLFSMEVVSVGVMYYAALVPCTVSALTAFQVAQAMGLHQSPGYEIGLEAALGPVTMVQAAALGILCALVSILFCQAVHTAPKVYARFLPNPLLRAAAGGALVLVLTLLVGSQDYNGAGDAVIRRMLAGETIPAAFLLKILFTALTLGAGFRGGEIVPALFTGPAPRLRRGAGDGGGVLRGHQLPPHLSDAGLRALRRREPPPVRPVLRGVLHALGLLRAVQRTEDRLLQIPHPVDRPEGGVTKKCRYFPAAQRRKSPPGI